MSMIRIRVTVEPRGGGSRPIEEIIEIDEEDLEGLSPAEREEAITKIAEETANEMAPWGWTEI